MKKNWYKYTIAFVAVFALRSLPFRAPNVEPVMAVLLPFGKVYSGIMSFIFGFSSVFLFDLVTSGIGIWTFITALCYGFVGVGASIYFKNCTGRKNYAIYAILATIVYDALTGLTIGPLFFHQSFVVSLVGQIPFTFLHLLGNVSFAIILSPAIESWASSKKIIFPVSWFNRVKV